MTAEHRSPLTWCRALFTEVLFPGAANVNEATRHLAADPVGRVSGDLDCSALHVGAEVHSGAAGDVNPPASHGAADPLHFRQVATELDFFRTVAHNIEVLVEALPALAEHDRQGADRVVRERREYVRRDNFRL
jgi:hypothetical protein